MPDESTEPVVRVTLTTIYDKLLDVDKKVDPIPAAIRDHETRIRSLEKHVWMWLGSASIGGGLVTVLVSRAIGG